MVPTGARGLSDRGGIVGGVEHSRTLTRDAEPVHWAYTRYALDQDAAIAWPGCVFEAERVEDVGDRDDRVRVVRTYTVPTASGDTTAAVASETVRADCGVRREPAGPHRRTRWTR